MAFIKNSNQQINMEDATFGLTIREKKMLSQSWADAFSKYIFPNINEERFSVLYSDNRASRPNTPVNVIIGSLILKELFNNTDEENMNSLMFDLRYKYALHTTSCENQPISDRTPSRFREKLYWYEVETGRDLMKEEMEALAGEFTKMLNLNPTMKRMDSLMVASSSKNMTRMEVFYAGVRDLVKAVNATGEAGLLEGRLLKYLEPSDQNNTIYRTASEGAASKLEDILVDAIKLIEIASETYKDLQEYKILARIINDQSEKTQDGIKLRDKKKISSTSLQNPSDEDATFRTKAGKNNKGYVANVVETFNGDVSIITGMEYELNTHSDVEFCKTVIEGEPVYEDPIPMLTDGAYGSEETIALAKAKNIILITTSLIGKSPDPLLAEFEIDEVNHVIISCPAGEKPSDSTYITKTDCYSSHFDKSVCMKCPNQNNCGVVMQKKSAIIRITSNKIKRSRYLKVMSQDQYKKFANMRNAVEAIPSLMRRKYRVDEMPVRGYVRSKCWFFLKVGAINVKRMLAYASFNAFCTFLYKLFYHFQFSRCNVQIYSKTRGFTSA